MSTNNFYYKNTDHCYAIVPDNDDIDFFEDFLDVDYLKDLFKQKFKNYSSAILQRNEFNSPYAKLLNHSETYLLSIVSDYEYLNFNITFEFYLKFITGYYEGGCLDFDYVILLESDEGSLESINTMPGLLSISDIMPEDVYYAGDNYEKETEQKDLKRIYNKVELLLELHSQKIQKELFESICTHKLNYLGSASNGEAFYKEAI